MSNTHTPTYIKALVWTLESYLQFLSFYHVCLGNQAETSGLAAITFHNELPCQVMGNIYLEFSLFLPWVQMYI